MRVIQIACIGLVVLALLGGPAAAQSPAPDETPAALRTLAILVIGDGQNPGMTNIEKRLTTEIVQSCKKAGISSHSLPIIAYHVDKPNERKYCEGRLGIRAGNLLVACVVEHQNLVVKTVLFKVERVQVPEIAAQQLVDRAQSYLQQDAMVTPPPSPDASASPPTPAVSRAAFLAYHQAVTPLEERRARLQERSKQCADQLKAHQMTPAQYVQTMASELLPALRDLVALSEKVAQGTPEVATLHGMFLEGVRYQLKAAEANQSGVSESNDTLLHLADNYDQLSSMAHNRYALELQRLELKYPQ